jgi:hypothetical protein
MDVMKHALLRANVITHDDVARVQAEEETRQKALQEEEDKKTVKRAHEALKVFLGTLWPRIAWATQGMGVYDASYWEATLKADTCPRPPKVVQQLEEWYATRLENRIRRQAKEGITDAALAAAVRLALKKEKEKAGLIKAIPTPIPKPAAKPHSKPRNVKKQAPKGV